MHDKQNKLPWLLGAALLVAVVLFGVRYGTSILHTPSTFDEKYITIPINNLILEGWSIDTAIDFQETKGPAMIWPYAVIGKLLGGTLNDLRLVSVLSSILAMWVLAWIAWCCELRKKQIYLVAVGWLLLPYNIVFSEIVMGEVSFVLLELLAVSCFIWGLKNETTKIGRVIAPAMYCLAIAVALHSRIHVVAVAGGVCLSAFMLLGIRSWPWWLASVLAGVLRIPLWYRWGGLVSPDYQALHGLGFRLESLAYLAAAMVPFVGVFAVEAWRQVTARRYLITAFVLGFILCMIAMPDLVVPKTIDFVQSNDRYQGVAATVALMISPELWLQRVVLSLLAGVGLAGLYGLWSCRRPDVATITSIVHEVCFWSMTLGWMLYALTRGFVFDRFLLVWAFLLPIIWVRVLSKKLLAVQITLLAIIAARLTMRWLV